MVIEDIQKEIINRFKKLNPYKIIIFGSFSNNSFNENSDLDIYVVTEDDFIPKNWNEKIEIYLKYSKTIRDLHFIIPIDLIVHTKGMYKELEKVNSSFLKSIKEGKIIWEKR